MVNLLLMIAAIFCAYQVIHAQRLLMSSIWLAFTSALVSILLYALGAAEVAVIELSVGAGLVTVLFVFAFSIVGEHTLDENSLVPQALAWALVILVSFLLIWFTLPVITAASPVPQFQFAYTLWRQRGLDVVAQIVFIFSGVMGLLGLLAESRLEKQVIIRRPASEALPGMDLTAPITDSAFQPEYNEVDS